MPTPWLSFGDQEGGGRRTASGGRELAVGHCGGGAVLARLPTAWSPLNLPKPHASRESTHGTRAVVRRRGAGRLSQYCPRVKSQAKSVLQNPHGRLQHSCWLGPRRLTPLERGVIEGHRAALAPPHARSR